MKTIKEYENNKLNFQIRSKWQEVIVAITEAAIKLSCMLPSISYTSFGLGCG